MKSTKYALVAVMLFASSITARAADRILDFSACIQKFTVYAQQSRPSVDSFKVLIAGICRDEELALIDTPLMNSHLDGSSIKEMNAESRAHSIAFVAKTRQRTLEYYIKWHAATDS